MSAADIASTIRAMDDKRFSFDTLTSLIDAMPVPAEVQMLRGYQGNKEDLGPAERFMFEAMAVTRVTDRLHCMQYMSMLDPALVRVDAQIAQMNAACDEVRASKHLKTVLEVVLTIGNQLNKGDEDGEGDTKQVRAVTLPSLLKLSQTRAFDKKTTVLQYMVRLVSANMPEVLDFPNEITAAANAARLLRAGMTQEQQQLRRGLQQIMRELQQERNTAMSAATSPKAASSRKAVAMSPPSTADATGADSEVASAAGEAGGASRLSVFAKHAKERLDDLDERLRLLDASFNSLLAYFGSASGSMQVRSMLCVGCKVRRKSDHVLCVQGALYALAALQCHSFEYITPYTLGHMMSLGSLPVPA